MTKYQVVLLVEESPGRFSALFSKVSAKSPGDATVDALMYHAARGVNLSLVRTKTVLEGV